MRPAISMIAVWAAAALLLTGCGSDDDSQSADETVTTIVTPPAPAAPAFVESDTCRSSATQVLDDAQAGADATDSNTAARYADLVDRGAAALDCSDAADAAVNTVVQLVALYAQQWDVCEVAGQWMDYDGDGQTESNVDCPTADRTFTNLSLAIDEARGVVDTQS